VIRTRLRRLSLRLANWPEVSGAKPLSGRLADDTEFARVTTECSSMWKVNPLLWRRSATATGFTRNDHGDNFSDCDVGGSAIRDCSGSGVSPVGARHGKLPLPAARCPGKLPAAESLASLDCSVDLARAAGSGLDPGGTGAAGRHSLGNAQSHRERQSTPQVWAPSKNSKGLWPKPREHKIAVDRRPNSSSGRRLGPEERLGLRPKVTVR